jgi:hypothetical protein
MWEMRGFCLLSETQGFYPDAAAAREVLNALNKLLHLNVDMNKVDSAAEKTREILESFGMVTQPTEEKRKEAPTGWRI